MHLKIISSLSLIPNHLLYPLLDNNWNNFTPYFLLSWLLSNIVRPPLSLSKAMLAWIRRFGILFYSGKKVVTQPVFTSVCSCPCNDWGPRNYSWFSSLEIFFGSKSLSAIAAAEWVNGMEIVLENATTFQLLPIQTRNIEEKNLATHGVLCSVNTTTSMCLLLYYNFQTQMIYFFARVYTNKSIRASNCMFLIEILSWREKNIYAPFFSSSLLCCRDSTPIIRDLKLSKDELVDV